MLISSDSSGKNKGSIRLIRVTYPIGESHQTSENLFSNMRNPTRINSRTEFGAVLCKLYSMSLSTFTILNEPSYSSYVWSSYLPHSEHPYSKCWRLNSKSTFLPSNFLSIFSSPDIALSLFLEAEEDLLDFSPPLQLILESSKTVSKKISKTESNWGSSKRELAAVCFGFVRFRQCLLEINFHLFVYNKALLYLDFCAGHRNILADRLSRLFVPELEGSDVSSKGLKNDKRQKRKEKGKKVLFKSPRNKKGNKPQRTLHLKWSAVTDLHRYTCRYIKYSPLQTQSLHKLFYCPPNTPAQGLLYLDCSGSFFVQPHSTINTTTAFNWYGVHSWE